MGSSGQPLACKRSSLPLGEGSLCSRSLSSQKKYTYNSRNEDIEFGDHPHKKKSLELTLVGEHFIQRFLQGFSAPTLTPLSIEGTAHLLGDVPLSLTSF